MKITPPAIAGLATIALAAGTAAASTDTELLRSYSLGEAAEAYDAINHTSNNIKVKAQVQARYQINQRDDMGTTLASADDDFTAGFVIRRAKVAVSGDITENMKGKVQFAFDREDGNAVLEDAVLSWKVNDDLTVRIGQFKGGVLREELVSSKYQLASERSASNETFNQDITQGVEFRFGGDQWRAAVSVNDGFGTDNTPIDSDKEADFGVSARAEFLLGDAGFGQFKQFTSWRGAAEGVMLGVAADFQSMGDTNPATAPTTDMTTLTADFSVVGDGWNAYAAGVWRSMDDGLMTLDDYGIVAQGGVFVSDNDEIFARWTTVIPDSDNGAGSDEDYSAVTVGWNHFLIPESHAAKFTLDFTYSLDATENSIVKVSDGHNLFDDSEDGQWGVIAQLQFLF